MNKFYNIYFNFLLPIMIFTALFLMYIWYMNSKNIKVNNRIMQGVTLFSTIVVCFSFAQLVLDAYSKRFAEEKNMKMNLSTMNNKYWVSLLKTFQDSNGGLDNLASEIFTGWEKKSKPNPRKEYFIIHQIFQMMVDIYRVHSIDNEIILQGWYNTFKTIFKSKKVRKQWEMNKTLYGSKKFHSYIDSIIKSN